jgi:Na+/H+-translocating membrane pyrophosphatase
MAAGVQVRRQFQERPGIMTYAEKPDYARCVSIVATSALKVTDGY